MGITSIASQLTPGNPTQITFAPNTGLPSSTDPLVLIGHQSATGGSASGANYKSVTIVNVADPVAAKTEAEGYFGVGTELAKMIVAAVAANQLTGNFPPITAIPLAAADTDFGTSDAALTAADKLPCSYLVSPYDANSQVNANKLLTNAGAMSAASRVDNGQYGTIAVAANQSVTSPASLFKYDTQNGCFVWLRNTTPTVTNGELAASVAAQLAGNQIPFNPVRNQVIPNLLAPAAVADWVSVGAGMESETALSQGWSPLRVLPNGSVAHVRARTLRVTVGDGVTAVTAYFDVPDFNVLYFWRKTLAARYAQPDFAQAKASKDKAQLLLSEVIRLATLFESQGMFQGVAESAKNFKVQRNVSDRSRFDVLTPVDVIPVLAVIATNVQAGTFADSLTL